MARRRTTRVTFAAALALAGCCPPPDPIEPSSLHAAPPVTPAQMLPAPFLSHFEQRRTNVSFQEPASAPPIRPPIEQPIAPPVAPPIVPPIVPSNVPPPQPPAAPPAGPKTETSRPREVLEPPVPPVHTDTLPDAVVLRLLESGRAAFVRCFKKAVAADPLVVSFKVRVHVELDGDGAITSATAETSDTALATCLTRAVRYLRFPASGRPVAANLPLFYRAE